MESKKIQWLEWSKEAFDKAKKEKKLILLDIHGTWCHWCHVMEQTTYSVPTVAQFVEENFVPIKVDTDRRPDINERYNSGGWPSTVVLTTTGQIVLQATYLPPQELLIFLKSALTPSALQKNVEAELLLDSTGPRKVLFDENELVNSVVVQARHSFDEYFGGFGTEPKFPMPDLLNFLELYHLYFHDQEVKNILLSTLSTMAQSGLFDSFENGFFRYSTTRDWSIPHYEKMLEDNAQLTIVYLNVYKLFGEELFLYTAEKTLSYMLGTLFDKKSLLFYSSQSADEEYYLHLAADRKKLNAPPVDKTIFTDLNSLAIDALFKAWAVTGKNHYKETAVSSLEALLAHSSNGKKLYHFKESSEKQEGFLSDHAFLLRALLTAFSYTQDQFFIEKAISINSIIEEKFLDKKTAGFFDTPLVSQSIGLLGQRKKPARLNSLMAENLFLLSLLKENRDFSNLAEKTQMHAASEALGLGVFGAASAATSLKSSKGFISAKISSPNADWEDFLRKILYNDFNNLVITGVEKADTISVLFCAKNKCIAPLTQIDGLELYEKI